MSNIFTSEIVGSPREIPTPRLALRGKFGLLIILLWVVAAIFAPLIAPYEPNSSDLMAFLQEPSFNSGHWLGTDDLGRDILSRVFYGARPVLLVATIATLLSALIGSLLGIVAGLSNRLIDQIIARIAEIQLTIPGLVLALLALALFGSRLENLILILALESWPLHFRVSRSYTLNARNQGYMEAAWLAGVPLWKSVLRHIVPGLLPLLIATSTISAAFIIMTEAGLSFIGLGIQPPTADWGLMIAQGKSQLGAAWWLSLMPALALLSLLFGVQLLGDSLSSRLSARETGEPA
ncbi:ABC transporter permease [Brucella pseudogrignonensis]|uniref:ABC transporter permease n=1 Tax=Brucella pseudogrignonensis TaxID=419475 RepID=UPI00190E213F|nr:ABC transporter permease [Brucella pseudogrignonensis]MBK0023682.1 ABC transporter permease [Ochrobactrum sp. S45]MBK0046449.1 ABC transporter permease [Ochrobactrum sp. S46]UKK94088.1 ABC transporter permease [Brucella pseudogrignonensis]